MRAEGLRFYEEQIEANEELSTEISFSKDVIGSLEAMGHEAYIAGGFCRDLLLGNIPKDVDIATSATPEELLSLNIPDVEWRLIDAAEAYPVVQALRTGMSLEVATFRKDEYVDAGGDSRRPDNIILDATLFDDAERRDLTINALYFNPLTGEMVDPTGTGIQDVEGRLVRFVGDPKERILEDRIRILRAIRFKNKLGFNYAEETEQALRESCSEVLKIKARDRIRTELTRMLTLPSRAEAIMDMDSLGILELILPEFTAGKLDNTSERA